MSLAFAPQQRTSLLQSSSTARTDVVNGFCERASHDQRAAGRATAGGLRIGSPNDAHEREAKAFADRVAPGRHELDGIAAIRGLGVKSKLVMGESRNPPEADPMRPDAEAKVNAVRGGRSLSSAERAFFEPRFGVDFSDVRIHDDAAADAAARATDADAYTMGNHVCFRAGHYLAHAESGRNLLAHELTHVVQQRRGGATRLVQLQKTGAETKAGADPLGEAHKETVAAVANIEAGWERIRRGGASAFVVLLPWLAQGDTLVALIRSHTEAWFKATASGDRELATAYFEAVKGDKTTYEFIAWHVVVYANLLALKPQMEDLISSFDHDDRAFTGRANAEKLVRQFETAAEKTPADAADKLKMIRTDVPLIVHKGAKNETTITVTSALIAERVAKLLVTQTAEMIELQINIERANEVVNNFLDTARKEGFEQAIDALEQYYNVKKALDGPSVDKRPGSKKSEETKPELHPLPLPAPMPGDDERKRIRRYPICWPVVLGPPRSVFFERVKSAERDEDEAKQARMALEWRRFRDPDFDPQKYHVHHVDPLFLGGPDDLKRNAITLEKGLHLRGHARLRSQPQMATPPAPLAPLPTDLYKHPDGIKYQLAGFKEEGKETC